MNIKQTTSHLMTAKDERTILLCAIGSAGDVNPFIAIGQELRRRGHRVVLCTSQYFESHARSTGLEFISLGTTEDYLSIIEDPKLWEPETGFKVFAERVILPILRPAYDAIKTFDPARTLLVAQGSVFAAHIAHEKLKFPFVTVQLQPAAFRSVYEFPMLPSWMPRPLKRILINASDNFVIDPTLAPEINRFRKEQSLPTVKHIFGDWMHSPLATIGLFPEWFASPQPDWPRQTHLTGFIFHDKRAEDEQLSQDVLDFLGAADPPVVFTLGTAMKHGAQFFEASIQACQILGRRGMLLTQHKDQLPSTLPEDIRHFDYLPFSLVLPRVAALVHHGGIGTIAQALSVGIPQVIRPMTHDQPDNAARVQLLGTGVAISPKDYTVQTVAEKLNGLLSSADMLAHTKEFAQRISAQRSLQETCDLIENLSYSRGDASTKDQPVENRIQRKVRREASLG
jgi:rhamnosyltransferase subunit B